MSRSPCCFSGGLDDPREVALVAKGILGIALSVTIAVATIPGMLFGASVHAETSLSLHIIKYASDNTTVLAEHTTTYAEMEAALPVQGDGATHYWMQGPTFDPHDLWNPTETLNLKDKGALKGTGLKEICELAGGVSAGDEVEVRSVDGFAKRFSYEDIYMPEAGQGRMVICWWKDGSYVPAFDEGMQLTFFVETTNSEGKYVFGNQDMQDFLPKACWHYYYHDGTAYPSSNGLSVKYVSQIKIFSTDTGSTGAGQEKTSLAPAEFTARAVPLQGEAYRVPNNVIVKNYEDRAYLFSISAQIPPQSSVREGYQPIPDSAWVCAAPASLAVEANSYGVFQLSINVPPEQEYAGQKWEVWIAVEDIDMESEMVRSVMVSRMKIETAAEVSAAEGGITDSYLWWIGPGAGVALLALLGGVLLWRRKRCLPG